MENISTLLYSTFGITTLITVLIFFKAAHWSRSVMTAITTWTILQSLIAITGFYLVTDTMPPRFALAVLPVVTLIISCLFFKKGKTFLQGLDLRTLTLLHVVRLPVEICLYALFQAKAIPELMTFSGSNPDILSGITAPVMFFLVLKKQWVGKNALIVWNLLCLLFLLNIVITAILSAPVPFQQLAFDQPNIGVMYFPFILLPAVIVPLVLLSHVAALSQLLGMRSTPALLFP